jgi:hypothetical protein
LIDFCLPLLEIVLPAGTARLQLRRLREAPLGQLELGNLRLIRGRIDAEKQRVNLR